MQVPSLANPARRQVLQAVVTAPHLELTVGMQVLQGRLQAHQVEIIVWIPYQMVY